MRLGSIEFINSLPVDLGLLRREIPGNYEMVQGPPSRLNDALLRGDLTVSPVSAFFFGYHAGDLSLLPDLSISSESGVMSVLLFSRYRIQQMKGRKIRVTDKGRTTPALLQILCRMLYGFQPCLVSEEGDATNSPVRDTDGALLIGDEALVARQTWEDRGFFVTDLAEIWERWTSTPMVFAVWAAKKSEGFSADEALKAHRLILDSRRWGKEHTSEILKEAGRRTGLPENILMSYFSHLSYGLDERLKNSMRIFFDKASECGLMKPVIFFQEIGGCVPAGKIQ